MTSAAHDAVAAPIDVVSGVAPVSGASLGVRLGLLRIANAQRVELAGGEVISKGCEVTFSSVCVFAERAVPLTALVEASVVIGEMPDNDLLSFELVGKRAAGALTFTSKLPTLFALPSLRGQPVTQQLWVKSARRLVMPTQVVSGDVSQRLTEELTAERLNAVAAKASERVIEVLASRLRIAPSAEAVHARASELWATVDRPRLVALGFDEAFLRRSHGAWVATPDVLDWARRQLMAHAVLTALFEAGILQVEAAANDAAATLRSVGLDAALLSEAGEPRAAAFYAQSIMLSARRQLMGLPCVMILDA